LNSKISLTIIMACLFAGSAMAASQIDSSGNTKTTTVAQASVAATVVATPNATTSTTKVDSKVAVDAGANTQSSSASTASTQSEHKSAALARTLAIIPGIALHGVGHMYAGAWEEGLGLFIVGTAGGYMAYDQANGGWSDIQNVINSFSQKKGQVPEDFSDGYSRLGLVLVGAVAFIWSGWDDLAGAGTAVDEYNQKIDNAAQAHVELLPANGGAMMAYTKRF
jgi:hypothetical protein